MVRFRILGNSEINSVPMSALNRLISFTRSHFHRLDIWSDC